jgi:hypothetical protein
MRTAVLGGLTTSFLLIVSGCGNGTADRGDEIGRSDARLITLRLSDLPRGFRIGDDSGCGGLDVEGASEKLADFVIAERPSGCWTEFNYVWGTAAAVPQLVETSAVIFDATKAAERGFGLRRDLLALTVGLGQIEEEGDAPGLGQRSIVFSTRNALVAGQIHRPGVGVVWRWGNLMNIVFEGGLAGEQGREVVLDLARKQQARAEHPTPISQTDTDDRDVSLDQPGLDLPVYWLGREFDPPGKLPPLELGNAVTLTPGGGPGSAIKIDYGAKGAGAGVTLDLWGPEAWKRFKGTRLGRMVWSWPCTDAKKLLLPEGRAVIYGGYAEPAREPCPSAHHDRFLAHVYLDAVVVAVNMPYCYSCARRLREGVADPYNSLGGMEAVLKDLRRR